MASVSLEQVGKTYPGGFQAVRSISLEIPNEEFVVLVGPSGCGKTTTLRMIAGLEEPTTGTIRIGDQVVNHVAPKDRDIAMVFQSYALYPHMTVYKNLAFALKLRRVPRAEIEKRVMWAADLLGLRELLDRRPRALSGGQRQRVAVGRAIVRQPKVFLFDEPLSNLDAKLRVTTRAELKRLQQSLKTTTIYVTHDQEEAMTLGDKVVVLHQGRIQQAGPPLSVYRAPANRFVAGFVGMPPMNFLEGTLERAESHLVFHSRALSFALTGPLLDRLKSEPPPHVTLGIRPEAFRLGNASHDGGITLQAHVEVVETLGPAIDVYARIENGDRVIARLEAQKIRPNENLLLSVPPQQIHLFAADRPDPENPGLTLFGENLLADGL